MEHQGLVKRARLEGSSSLFHAVSEDILQTIWSFLGDEKALHVLEIKQADLLADLLPHAPLRLHLRPDAKLTSEQIRATFDGLKHSNSVLHLLAPHFGLLGPFVPALSSALTSNRSITFLDLSYTKLAASACTILSRAFLSSPSSLLHLILRGNAVGDVGVSEIANCLDNLSLVSIDLSSTSMGREGGIAVFRAVQRNSTLKKLSIGHNYMQDSVATYVGEMLRDNATLRTLEMQRTAVDSQGLCTIFRALSSNSALSDLNVSGEQDWQRYGSRRDEIGLELENVVSGRSLLRTLDLSSNAILLTQGGFRSFTTGLAHNQTLTSLSLWKSGVDSEALGFLTKALASNGALETLNLGFNLFSEAVCLEFLECIGNNQRLYSIDLTWMAFPHSIRVERTVASLRHSKSIEYSSTADH